MRAVERQEFERANGRPVSRFGVESKDERTQERIEVHARFA
jgi:hypothetical protein